MPESLAATRIEAAFLGRSNKPCNSFLVAEVKKKGSSNSRLREAPRLVV